MNNEKEIVSGEEATSDTNVPQTKREKAAIRREEKENQKKKAKQLKRTKKLAVIIGVIAIVAGIIYLGSAQIKKTNASRLGDHHAIQGDDHIEVGEAHEEYSTNPPTSGSHGNAIKWGVYDEELPDENVVHNLEHGGIWISYTGLNQDIVVKLEELAKRHPKSVIMTPRSANDSPIAVASWGRLMKLDIYDEVKIEEYIRQNINKSPEPLAR